LLRLAAAAAQKEAQQPQPGEKRGGRLGDDSRIDRDSPNTYTSALLFLFSDLARDTFIHEHELESAHVFS